jgi:hypothetical protein
LQDSSPQQQHQQHQQQQQHREREGQAHQLPHQLPNQQQQQQGGLTAAQALRAAAANNSCRGVLASALQQQQQLGVAAGVSSAAPALPAEPTFPGFRVAAKAFGPETQMAVDLLDALPESALQVRLLQRVEFERGSGCH